MNRTEANSNNPHSMHGASQGKGKPDSPRLFTFLRDSVGAGEIKGERERWVAPAALYTGSSGIGESSWTTTTETVLAIRLHGAVVEDHNRRVKRVSGPGRDFSLQPKGTSTRYLSFSALEFGHVFLPDALLDRAADVEHLPALSARLRDDLSFVPNTAVHVLTKDYLRRAFDPLLLATALEMEGRALLLVDALLRLHETLRAASEVQRGGLSPRHLRRTCDFITDRLADDIGLDELAELTGLSCKHFVRAFKQSTGVPPYKYLILQRIESAKRRLIGGNASLADIAIQCGFADQSHFAATFRRIVGVPPGTWRREHAK